MADETKTINLSIGGVATPVQVPSNVHSEDGIKAYVQKKYPEVYAKITAANSKGGPPKPQGMSPEAITKQTAPGGGAAPPQPGMASRFGKGLYQGANLFHTPQLQTPGTMSTPMNVLADAANVREMGNKAMSGDVAGVAGEFTGTLALWFGPAEVKGLLGGEKAIKGLKGAAEASAASKFSNLLRKEVSGTSAATGSKVARLLEPILDHLNQGFEKIHAKLDKEAVATSPALLSEVDDLIKSPDLIARRIGQSIKAKMKAAGGLEYGEAHRIQISIADMLSKLSKGQGAWVQKLGAYGDSLTKINEELEAGKYAVAKAKKLGKAWESLGKDYKAVHDLGRGMATDLNAKGAGWIHQMTEKLGLESMPKGSVDTAKQLAEKVGVDPRKLPISGLRPGKAAANTAQFGAPVVRGADPFHTQGPNPQ